jgi:hypothetical protein
MAVSSSRTIVVAFAVAVADARFEAMPAVERAAEYFAMASQSSIVASRCSAFVNRQRQWQFELIGICFSGKASPPA